MWGTCARISAKPGAASGGQPRAEARGKRSEAGLSLGPRTRARHLGLPPQATPPPRPGRCPARAPRGRKRRPARGDRPEARRLGGSGGGAPPRVRGTRPGGVANREPGFCKTEPRSGWLLLGRHSGGTLAGRSIAIITINRMATITINMISTITINRIAITTINRIATITIYRFPHLTASWPAPGTRATRQPHCTPEQEGLTPAARRTTLRCHVFRPRA